MKLKTLAMLAASGLMAASFAYVVPAYATEFSGDEEVMAPQSMQLADNSSATRQDAFPGENGGMNNNANNSANNSANTGAANGAGNNANNATNRVDTNTSASANNITSPSANPAEYGNTGAQANEQGTPDVASGDDDY